MKVTNYNRLCHAIWDKNDVAALLLEWDGAVMDIEDWLDQEVEVQTFADYVAELEGQYTIPGYEEGTQFFKIPELTPEELATYTDVLANCGEVYVVSSDEIEGQPSFEDFLKNDDD